MLVPPCRRFAFDWDNVFWPLNLLMAQETGKGTFHKQTELFLRNWICAGNSANYTSRGRAYNPMSGELRVLPFWLHSCSRQPSAMQCC